MRYSDMGHDGMAGLALHMPLLLPAAEGPVTPRPLWFALSAQELQGQFHVILGQHLFDGACLSCLRQRQTGGEHTAQGTARQNKRSFGATPPVAPSPVPPPPATADCGAPSALRQPAGAARSKAQRSLARPGYAVQDGLWQSLKGCPGRGEGGRLAYLFVAHDLSVVRHISDRVAVMYVGHLVEMAPTDKLFATPKHPYTAALLSAVPEPDPRQRAQHLVLQGEVANPAAPPSGCYFHPRYPHAVELCRTHPPTWEEIAPGHFVSCHRARELRLSGVHELGSPHQDR